MPNVPRTDVSPAAQLAEMVGRFSPPVRQMIRAARAALRRAYPTAIELVYDNYNALAIGFCSTPRASDCLVSIAAYAGGVNLYFYYGASLPDPSHRLQGSGRQGRFVRIESLSTLEERAVQTLLRSARRHARTPLPRSSTRRLIIQSVSARRRPRQPKTAPLK
jgi:hypothetical protein